MRILVALFLLLSACSTTTSYAPLVERVKPAVVLLEMDTGSLCAGTIIQDARIVTAAHCTWGATEFKVTLSNGEVRQAVLISESLDVDLAFLTIFDRSLPSVPVGDFSKVKEGDVVLVAGHPYALTWTFTVGIVSALREKFNAGANLQTDAAVNPGNSGGPVFNMDGELIGVTSQKHMGADGLGFTVPSSYVIAALEALDANVR